MQKDNANNIISAFESVPSGASRNLIPAFEGARGRHTGRFIGAILVDAGKLTLEEVERIVQIQREEGLRFGEAATKLGLIREGDLQQALAHQFDYPYLMPGEGEISPEVIAAYHPFDRRVEALRALRAQITLRWLNVEEGGKALSVVGSERGEGRSYLAANLAVVYSQLGERTLLIDADMRNPRQHQLFKVDNRSGLSAILSGRGEMESIQRVPAFRELSIIPAGALPPNPQELLARSYFPRLLDELAKEYNVIIVDTPAGARVADAQFACRGTRAALMVVRRNQTRIRAAHRFIDELTTAKVKILGAVLNEF